MVGLVVFVGAMVCAVTYAGRHRKKNVQLPEAVREAVDMHYPQAVIEEVKREKEGPKIYEIELEQNGQDFELTVAPDGTVVETESEVAVDSLPDAVKKAILDVASGARIKEVSKEITYLVVKLVALDEPRTTYEAELDKAGKEIEIEVAADGTVLKVKAEEDEDRDEDGDDGENEQEVSIDQVPAAVKATILEQAQGATIKEIEIETEHGKTVYEAEVVGDAGELEIKVAADGTLISKAAENHDERDDEDDDD